LPWCSFSIDYFSASLIADLWELQKKAEELQQKLDTALQEKEALLAENQRLQEGTLALQEKGSSLNAALAGQRSGSLGTEMSKLNGILWANPAPQGQVKEFVPAKGYDIMEADSILVLSVGQNMPIRLSKQNVQGMTTWDIAHILQVGFTSAQLRSLWLSRTFMLKVFLYKQK
jgi:hypothetical protein